MPALSPISVVIKKYSLLGKSMDYKNVYWDLFVNPYETRIERIVPLCDELLIDLLVRHGNCDILKSLVQHEQVENYAMKIVASNECSTCLNHCVENVRLYNTKEKCFEILYYAMIHNRQDNLYKLLSYSNFQEAADMDNNWLLFKTILAIDNGYLNYYDILLKLIKLPSVIQTLSNGFDSHEEMANRITILFEHVNACIKYGSAKNIPYSESWLAKSR